MGQTVTHMKRAVPDWLKKDIQKIHVELRKDLSIVKGEVTLARDIATIDYSSLRDTIAGINTILKSCCTSNREKIMFGLQSMESHRPMWKAFIKIICFKINVPERTVTAVRDLTLYQFWRLRGELLRELHYKEILDENCDNGFEFVDEPLPEGDEPNQDSDSEITEAQLNLPNQMTVSIILDRVNQVGNNIEQDECLICMDNKVEVSLPCAHSFCSKCINQWNIESPTCPTCREQVNTPEEFWEFTDMPNIDQMNRQLLALATGT